MVLFAIALVYIDISIFNAVKKHNDLPQSFCLSDKEEAKGKINTLDDTHSATRPSIICSIMASAWSKYYSQDVFPLIYSQESSETLAAPVLLASAGPKASYAKVRTWPDRAVSRTLGMRKKPFYGADDGNGPPKLHAELA